jgi:hypothetical protein
MVRTLSDVKQKVKQFLNYFASVVGNFSQRRGVHSDWWLYHLAQ